MKKYKNPENQIKDILKDMENLYELIGDLNKSKLEDLNVDGQNNLIYKAMKKIDNNNSGIVIIINDSYKDFISKKLKADEEIETKDKSNLRQYGVGAQILSDLGVKNMTLLSNSKKKAIGLKGFNLSIVDWEGLN